MSFLACRVYEQDKKTHFKMEKMTVDQLSSGDVVIRVVWSGVNYKDALAATGKGRIMKRFPLNAGIDLAGLVESSKDERFKPGDPVILNGCGLGEAHDGGLAEYVRVPADWVMPLPEGLTLKESMILGTAGFTAALAIHRMRENGQTPDKGPIVVTGASGGVGSVALSILDKLGYDTVAISGRSELHDYVRALGAAKVVSPKELELSDKPLDKAHFGGMIDNVGGELLSKLLAQVDLWGNVASIGLAGGHQLDATVFPFILRGVSILGISSTNCPMPVRRTIWQKLAGEFKPPHLALILQKKVELEHVGQVFEDLLARKLHGRVIVRCCKDAGE